MSPRRRWLEILLLGVGLGNCGGQRAPEPEPSGPSVPLRIASQTVLSDEILWAMGDSVRARVVAVSVMADDRRYSPVADQWPVAVPRVGGTAEALLAVGPDLAIVASFTAIETRNMLERAGVRMLVLDRFDGFEAYRATLGAVGDSVGASAEAKRLLEEFEAGITAIESRRTASRPEVISWNDGTIAGAGTTFDDAAATAGFSNLATAHGFEGHGRIGIEMLVSWDPNYLVIPCGELACDRAERQFAEGPGVGRMSAVMNHRVIGIDSAILYSAGQTMVELADTLARRKELDP